MDNYSYKKENENEHLGFFIEFYEEITESTLELFESTERPDFICKRNDGSFVGIELVQVRRGHPESVRFDEIVNKRQTMAPEKSIDMILESIEIKEHKLR